METHIGHLYSLGCHFLNGNSADAELDLGPKSLWICSCRHTYAIVYIYFLSLKDFVYQIQIES